MDREKGEVRVFYSYSHKDEHYREQLEEHLTIFKRAGLIQGWSDRKILPGKEWQSAIDENLDQADLILMLVSSSFIASDYCYDKELALAISRHESGTARVVPIFIRPFEWKETPFAGIQGLPKDALPVAQWTNEDVAWKDIASGLRAVISDIREQKERQFKRSGMRTLQEALTDAVEQIDTLYNREDLSEVNGIPTGLVDLDRITGGLHPGGLYVIASRPSVGKTNLALNIASAVAEHAGLPVVIFSTKMSASEVSRRLVTVRGRIQHNQLSRGLLRDEDWPKLTHAIQSMMDSAVLIDDSPTISLADLRERCLEEKKRLGALALVVIDSVAYLRADSSHLGSTGGVGQFLKLLARELNATIVVTTHVSRNVESRPNKRPVLRDIENFPDLVDEADLVTFIYVDSNYNPDSPDRGTAEIIIAKNQYGSAGTVRLVHAVEYGLFQTYSGEIAQ
jgi:replicative DNA helicase